MFNVITKITFFFVVFLISFCFGQDNMIIKAQFRYRFEMNNKNFNRDIGYNNFNLLRSRIGLSFKPVQGIHAFFQLQDSRIKGEESSTLDGSANNLDMHQAFVGIDSIFALPLFLALGRFEVLYFNERLIGAVGWHNIGRSFDGVTLYYVLPKVVIDVFNYKINEELRQKDKYDLNFMGFWISLNQGQKFSTDFFSLRRKEFGVRVIDDYTVGSNIRIGMGKLSGTAELAYQSGRLDSLRNISAYMAMANFSYHLSHVFMNPEFLVGVDLLSGDNDISNDKYKVFNTLYATNHKFYGIMDYFINIPQDTDGYGLMDIHFGLNAQPLEKIKLKVLYHIFKSREEYRLSLDERAKDFGNELDAIINYIYNKNIALQFGAAVFFPKIIFKTIKGEDHSTFFYLSLTANI